jgi:hypothetical protein
MSLIKCLITEPEAEKERGHGLNGLQALLDEKMDGQLVD